MTTKDDWQRERMRRDVASGRIKLTPRVQAFLDGATFKHREPTRRELAAGKLDPGPLTDEQRAAVDARDWSRFQAAEPTPQQREVLGKRLDARIAAAKMERGRARFNNLTLTSGAKRNRATLKGPGYTMILTPGEDVPPNDAPPLPNDPKERARLYKQLGPAEFARRAARST